MNKKKKKALLNISDPIFSKLAPEGSLLRDCLIAAKWDDKNEGSASLAHYNNRLYVSKLLQAIELDDREAKPLIKLLSSQAETLTNKDVIEGLKCAELIYKRTLPLKRANVNSVAFRNFIKNFSKALGSGNTILDLPYESILLDNSKYERNADVDLYEVRTKGGRKHINFVDPDLFPTLFKAGSVLDHMLTNMESSTKEKPIEYTVLTGFKSQLRDIDDWPYTSLIKHLLNEPLHAVSAESINEALIDYERRIYVAHPDKQLNQMSTLFRQQLFDFGLVSPELNAAKSEFKPNFDRSGNLKFKSSFTIRSCAENKTDENKIADENKNENNATDNDYIIDGFKFVSIMPTDSVGEHCFSRLEEQTKHAPIQTSAIKKLLELLTLIEEGDYTDARLLFARQPEDLVRYYVTNGLKEIEDIIIQAFPDEQMECLSIIRDFLNLCPVTTKNGLLLSEMDIDSKIAPKQKPHVLSVNSYSKTNGKKKQHYFEFNLTKIKPLLKLDGTLVTSLNQLKANSQASPLPSTMLSNIDLVLGYIVESKDNALIKHVLTAPLTELTQRDFRLAFAQLEDIIDIQDINTKAARSQMLRTFLSKNAGKINGQIEIKDCGFSTRFSASDERNTQKLIEPVDEHGELLPSPVLEKHESLEELKKRVREYINKPINQILEACTEELAQYIKLVSCFSTYTAVDQDGQYLYKIPDEVTSLVLESQHNEGKGIKLTRVSLVRERFTNEVLMGAYVRYQVSIGPKSRTYCLAKAELIPEYVQHWFPNTGTGMKDFFWCSVFLPKSILLVCFIRLLLRTTWNKDVVAILTRSNLPDSLPDGPFTIGGFKEKVSKHTTPVKIEPHEKEIREVISFLIQHHDNMISYGLTPESLWDTPDSTKLSFLSASTIDSFREHYTLPYFRMELLAKHQINLRKGIDGDVIRSQMERNHGSLRVTSGYLSHPIAQLEYEANNADFQRRLETTVQFRKNEKSLKKYGFDAKNIDTDLLVAPGDIDENLPEWFLLPDGSSCTDIFSSVDRSKKDSICRGRMCHSGEGCEFNRVEIGVDEFVYSLRNQAYYLSRGTALLDKHGQEYFDKYFAPDMRFTFGLVKYVELANSVLFKEAKGRLDNA